MRAPLAENLTWVGAHRSPTLAAVVARLRRPQQGQASRRLPRRFRGREMAHQELGYQLLNRVKDDTSKVSKVEQEPRFEGRQVVMVLAPR